MSIVKNTPNILKHSKLPFTTILNKTIEAIRDPAALGIYVYLASKPGDWDISETNLQNRFGKCRDFIRARISELKRLGLIKTTSIRNEKNHIVRWETTLYNEPQIDQNTMEEHCTDENSTLLENQVPGKARCLVEPPTTNKRLKEIKEVKIKDIKTPISPKGESVRFEEFWNLYPVKNGRKACEQKWRKRKLDDIADKIIQKLVVQVEEDDKWQRGFAPNPLTYINQDRWEDEIAQAPKTKSSKSDSFNKYLNSQAKGETYDQHGNTYDPFR